MTPRSPLWGNPAAREPLKLEVLDRSQAGERAPPAASRDPAADPVEERKPVTSTRPVAVIVLAAGGGTRMRSSTPKVLHRIGGRTLLGHSLVAAGSVRPER